MPPPNSDDDLLAREIGKLGSLGGKFGGLFVGDSAAGRMGGMGGEIGAKVAARFLPTETYSEDIVLSLDPATVLRLGHSVLSKLGKVKRSEDNNLPHPLIKAIVGAGFLNMNPAVAYLEVFEVGSAGCRLKITAAAKEGLIKQGTAGKAVRRIVAAVRDRANVA